MVSWKIFYIFIYFQQNNLKYKENLFIVQHVAKLNTQTSRKVLFCSAILPLPNKILVFLELYNFIHFHRTHRTKVQSPNTGLCLRREYKIFYNLSMFVCWVSLKTLLGFLSVYFQSILLNYNCRLAMFILVVFPVQLWIFLTVFIACGRK